MEGEERGNFVCLVKKGREISSLPPSVSLVMKKKFGGKI